MYRMLLAAVLLMVVPAAALAQTHQPSYRFQAETQDYRDANGRLMGREISRPNKSIEAWSSSGMYLGYYDPTRNKTFTSNNRYVGAGNQLASLITSNYEAKQAQRIAREGDRRTDTSAPVIGPLTKESPETEARLTRMGAQITGGDRIIAREALTRAGNQIGAVVEWKNPQTGHSGSFLLREEDRRTARWLNGFWVECRFANVTLNVGGETDTQYVTACKFPESDWRVVLVNAGQ